MLPWGHAAVGYLCYTLIVRFRQRSVPVGTAVLALGLGTQIPDLIDKPLAWTFGFLPSGRSLGHSLLFVLALGAGIWLLARRYDRRPEAGAFIFGHLTHIGADLTPAVLVKDWAPLGALLWPLTPAYQYPGELDRSIIKFFLQLQLAELPLIGTSLTAIALGVWVYDGAPGLTTITEIVN